MLAKKWPKQIFCFFDEFSIFDIDLNIYNNLINEIKEDKRDNDDIPELFKNKFIIFNHLYMKSDINYAELDNLDKYNLYNNFSKQINLSNNTFNTSYDDLFNVSNQYKNSDSDSGSDSGSGSDSNIETDTESESESESKSEPESETPSESESDN